MTAIQTPRLYSPFASTFAASKDWSMLPPSHRLFPPVIQKVEGKKSLGCHQDRWLSKATLNRHLRRSKRCAGRFGQVKLTPILSANLTPKPKQVTCSFENLTLITQISASVQLLLRSSGLESQLSAARLTFPPKLAGRALSWLASLAGWGQGLKKLIKTALINGISSMAVRPQDKRMTTTRTQQNRYLHKH